MGNLNFVNVFHHAPRRQTEIITTDIYKGCHPYRWHPLYMYMTPPFYFIRRIRIISFTSSSVN